MLCKKGLDPILKFSKLRKISKKYLKKYLEIKSRESKIEIHGKCRKRFTDSWTIDSEFIQWKRLRSSFTTFSRKTNCFFCDEVATVDKKLSGRNGAYAVSTLTTKNWSLHRTRRNCESKIRILHQSCSRKGYIPWHVSKRFILKKETATKTPGRPKEITIVNGFNKLSLWLDNQSEPTTFSIIKLHSKMKYLSGSFILFILTLFTFLFCCIKVATCLGSAGYPGIVLDFFCPWKRP